MMWLHYIFLVTLYILFEALCASSQDYFDNFGVKTIEGQLVNVVTPDDYQTNISDTTAMNELYIISLMTEDTHGNNIKWTTEENRSTKQLNINSSITKPTINQTDQVNNTRTTTKNINESSYESKNVTVIPNYKEVHNVSETTGVNEPTNEFNNFGMMPIDNQESNTLDTTEYPPSTVQLHSYNWTPTTSQENIIRKKIEDNQFTNLSFKSTSESPWRWTCNFKKCLKIKIQPHETRKFMFSLNVCKFLCNDYGSLWPKTTGITKVGRILSKISLDSINYPDYFTGQTTELLQAAIKRFKNIIAKVVPPGVSPSRIGRHVTINFEISNVDYKDISLTTPEEYTLEVSGKSSNNSIDVTITAYNFFGARHGLETLSQLFVYDDIRNHVLMVRDVYIKDTPMYPYRGILLDTGRNYFEVDTIKSTIDTMAMVKLNTLHWHITDSQSFPFVSERRPNLSKFGAYSPAQVYTKQDIREIVQYALERGIRILPEIDVPAHVGEGWVEMGLTVCFKTYLRSEYCSEPPCGQLNPIKDEVYEYLGDIYSDMADVFQTDLIHMGGDDVNNNCWNSSKEIQEFMLHKGWKLNKDGFLRLWDYFLKRAQDLVFKAFDRKPLLILWSSHLTNSIKLKSFLQNKNVVIQVRSSGKSSELKHLLFNEFRVILSNYDALYFNYSYGTWYNNRDNNPKTAYIDWQKVYEHDISNLVGLNRRSLLGAEAAVWSQQLDALSLSERLWPRAAALAERLWADPASGWGPAQPRILNFRERLVRQGIRAEKIAPEWCYQNEGFCY